MCAEHSRGTLKPGTPAERVMIDTNVTRAAAEKISDARVVLTVVGGQVVHRAPAAVPAKIAAD